MTFKIHLQKTTPVRINNDSSRFIIAILHPASPRCLETKNPANWRGLIEPEVFHLFALTFSPFCNT